MNKSYINALAQRVVIMIIQSTLGFMSEEDELDIYSNSSFGEDLGCDELDMMELIMSVERNLNIDIDDSCITNLELTVQDLIDLCADKIAAALNDGEDYDASLPKKKKKK